MRIYKTMASCLLLLAAAGCHSRVKEARASDDGPTGIVTTVNDKRPGESRNLSIAPDMEHGPSEILTIAKDSLRPKPDPATGTKAKNIILVILDGVSFNQILA